MSKVKINILANILGRGWAVLSTIIFLPLYLKLLGVEAYGLVGIFASLQGVIAFTDMGLTATLNREMARLSSFLDAAEEMGDTLRTIESIYFLIIIIVSTAIYLSSDFIATRWVNAQSLSTETISFSVEFMSFALAFQVATTLYQGGLIGLQRQVRLNYINVVSGIAKAAVTLFVLWQISATIEAFFICQLAVNAFQAVWIRTSLWGSLPVRSRKANFSCDIIKNVWQYSLSMLGMTLTASILLQADKVMLSKMLSLEMFGYYSLAWTFAQTPISVLSNPVYQAVFPKLTQYVAVNAHEELAVLYHRACQAVSVLVFPVTAVVCLFSKEALYAWLGNLAVASSVATLESVLIASACLTGVLIMPYALVLAYGWTSLSLKMNCLNIAVLIPILFLLVSRLGAIGAGIGWLTLNTAYMIFFIYFMHNRLLKTEKWKWYIYDILLPAVGAVVPASMIAFLGIMDSSRAGYVFQLVVVWFFSTCGAVLLAGRARNFAYEQLMLFVSKRSASGIKP